MYSNVVEILNKVWRLELWSLPVGVVLIWKSPVPKGGKSMLLLVSNCKAHITPE